ncbi:dihydrodipicolinate synthase family protein [Planosporangium sp. 12N6]|uniref:dihydrodipicolinate synthase family protein n=1 Tax=Planosporangium spinosum TaxID=3402278 RepID=UPI003CEA8751
MTCSVVVPTLTPLTPDGRIDRAALPPYVQRAAATWVDAFLVSGSTTRGDLLTVAQRAEVLDIWLETIDPSRLIACCWHHDDLAVAARRGIAPMMVMRDLPDTAAALRLFADLPPGSYIYSHPMYTPTVLDARLAATATAAGVLPAGGKIAKIGLDGITALRAVVGDTFQLWDGSSRRIAASVRAGATGVIATPLSPIPTPFPPRELAAVQAAVDHVQAELDALPDRPHRTAMLQGRAFHATAADA